MQKIQKTTARVIFKPNNKRKQWDDRFHINKLQDYNQKESKAYIQLHHSKESKVMSPVNQQQNMNIVPSKPGVIRIGKIKKGTRI